MSKLLDFEEYQKKAQLTSAKVRQEGFEQVIPLLGLAGEVGELLTEHKKSLRDGSAYQLYNEKLAEELGDILWYVAETASNSGLSLNEIALRNLRKTESRWGNQILQFDFDENFPENERLPDRLEVSFSEEIVEGKRKAVIFVNGEKFGDDLTDNAHYDDGYRFHDVLHFAFMAVLGWSPLVRHLLKRKRKSVPEIDEVEDGARARVIEEGISAIIFSFADDHSFYEGITQIDTRLLEVVTRATAHLEVSRCSKSDWERAILVGFEAWRKMSRDRRGILVVDRRSRTLFVQDS